MRKIIFEYKTGIKNGLWNAYLEKLTIYTNKVEYQKTWYVNLDEYKSIKDELMYSYKNVEWKISGGTNESILNNLYKYFGSINAVEYKLLEDNDSLNIYDDSSILLELSINSYFEVKKQLREIIEKALVDEVKVPEFLKISEEEIKEASIDKQIKSRERVEKHGEVFTNEREVKAMCDLVKQETERIDSRFLEPACGDGNFLIEILARKLEVVKKKYKKSPFDYEKQSLLAISSIYGVDIMQDNVIECRNRLYTLWEKQYKSVCKKECNEDTKESIKFILRRNIVCGNALTLRQVDENGIDKNEPIIFSEWAFVTGNMMQRSDYTFAEMLEQKEVIKDCEGIFLKKYVTNYRSLKDYE